MTKIISNKSNIDLDYPVVRPSLDLDFTQEVLDPRITFSRGSIGTRVNRNRLIETVSANLPRFDYDPVTGGCKGLLIEESRTNLMTGSDDFGPTYWVPLNSVSVSTNVITAPDGTLTADKFKENILGVSSHKVIARSFTLSASTTYTFSVFVKSAERTNIMIHLRKSDYTTRFGGFFNLSTKTFTSETAAGGTLVSSSITQFPNDWYRISVTGDIGTNTAAITTLYLCNTSNSISYAGDGTSGIYLWGAQLEAGAFPTSYIPTTGSTATRSADRASITGTNFSSWYNQTEGSVVTAFQKNSTLTGYNFGAFSLTSSLSNRFNVIDYFPPAFTIYYSGRAQVYESGGPGNVTEKIKGAFSFTTNKFSKCVNGTLYFTFNSPVVAITSGIKIPTVDRLVLGPYWGGVKELNGTMSRFTYYPRALKPNQLRYLTQ